ncbi:MAG: peptide-methionine (R)-S-oxide reductase MsrB [Planctomycetota bacterium]
MMIKAIAFVLAAGIGAMTARAVLAPKALTEGAPRVVSVDADATNAGRAIYSDAGYNITPLPREQVALLASTLDEEIYRITQKAGTEPAFCGTLLDNKKDGFYACVVCGLPLFSSEHKFDSGTGWPSFFQPVDAAHVGERADLSYGMVRTEITCVRCDSHLGHVFDDGPKPSGDRHCVNSASLVFIEKGEPIPERSRPVETEVAFFAGGCFWGVEYQFERGDGVLDVVSGFMQGTDPKLAPEGAQLKDLGHAETVRVVYDPSRISYRRLLEAHFVMHDPTQLNRQGPDFGTEYRSGVWYVNDVQKAEAEAYMQELRASGRFSKPIVTQVEPVKSLFYPAAAFHQDFVVRTGRVCLHKDPW